jgi:hypothetical protein
MEFRTRSIAQVLDDLVAKLEQISPRHPDRPRLTRMVIDLQREIERRLLPASAGDCWGGDAPQRPHRSSPSI